MKTAAKHGCGSFLALAFATLLGLAVAPVQARDYNEIYGEINSARKNIEAAEKSIEASEAKVRQALSAIENAEHFEGPHWGALEQSVREWEAVLNQAATTIDSNAKTILRLDPGAQVQLRESEYFGIGMRSLRDQLRGIQKNLKAAIQRAEESRQRQSKIKLGALDDIKDGVVDLTLNTAADVLGIPTSVDDAAGAIILKSVEIAGYWFAKPLDLANSGVKFVVNFYYLADETKSGMRIIRTANEVDAFAQEFISRTQADIASAQQGIDIVERLWQQAGDARSKFNQTQSSWRKLAEESSKALRNETVQKFDQELEKPMTKQYTATYWPAPPTPPIEASEYENEAESVLRELRSAAMAATDGGSPLAYLEIKHDHERRIGTQIDAARAKYEATSAVLGQASETYWRTMRAASERYSSCISGCRGLRGDEGTRCWNACSNSYSSTENQARTAVVPPATAASMAQREVHRLNLIHNHIRNRREALDQMIRDTADATRARYQLTWNEHQQRYETAYSELSAKIALIPPPHTLDYLRNQPQWVKWDIDIWLRDNPTAARDSIVGTAKRIRDIGQDAKAGLTGYRALLPEVVQASQTAQNELNSMIDRFTPLLRFYQDSEDYTQASIDEYGTWYKKTVKDKFTFTEPDYLSAAASFPYESIAQEVESHLPALESMIAKIDLIKFRLSNMNAALDKVSRKLTGQALYSPREPVASLVAKEFASGSWAGFTNRLQAVTERRHAFAVPQLGHLLPRQRLLSFQAAFLNHVNTVMGSYLNASTHGGFVHVDPRAYEEIRQTWEGLKPLYAMHEQIAAPLRAKLAEETALLPDETNLHKAYAALSQQAQGVVQTRYFAYRNESSWLRDYLARQQSELQTVADPMNNNVMAALEKAIEGYPAAKAEAERREAEARARYEKQMEEERKRVEAEEKARQQRETQARQAEQDLLAGVHTLYQKFVDAYGRGDIRGILALLASDWQGGDGADTRDVEDTLINSFKVFDRIQYRISNLSVQPAGNNKLNVSYSVRIIGDNSRQRLHHEEASQIVEEVGLVDGKVRILRTLSGNQWLR